MKKMDNDGAGLGAAGYSPPPCITSVALPHATPINRCCCRTELLEFVFEFCGLWSVTCDTVGAAAATHLRLNDAWRGVKWGPKGRTRAKVRV